MGELIERQMAIDALDRIFDRCEEIEAHLPEGDPDRTGYKMFPDYMTVWKYLHQLPSAQPERKTGRLIHESAYNWYRCSVCKKVYSEALLQNFNECMYQPCFRYCPNCGADMREEGDE